MATGPVNELPLAPYRVLDLTDEMGLLCGRLLGDLGADIVKVEPPGGSPARMHGPYYHDEADAETSLYWSAYNTNKRSITLDIEAERGARVFKTLAETADFVIESFPPGHMDSLGLGPRSLLEVNPRLVVTSITPFGQDGPYSGYKADDIVGMAIGGLMAICGDEDRPPLRVGVPMAYAFAGSHAAAGTMIAHFARQRTGRGRHVDVSMHEAIVNALVVTQQHWHLDKEVRHRGAKGNYGGRMTSDVYKVKEGHVNAQLFWGPGPGNRMRALAKWMADEGYECDFRTHDFNQLHGFSIKQEQVEQWEDEIAGFLSRFTKAECFDEALKRRVFLLPVNSPRDLAGSAQLQARGFFEEVQQPAFGGTVRYPGSFCQFSETPISIRRRPPSIGEHTLEVLCDEAGFSRDEVQALQDAGVV